MSDLHAVYAVAQEFKHKLRVSEPMSYSDALDLWGHLEAERAFYEDVIVSKNATRCVTAARMPVAYFCVRSTDDPNWPSTAPRSRVRDSLSSNITDDHGNYIN